MNNSSATMVRWARPSGIHLHRSKASLLELANLSNRVINQTDRMQILIVAGPGLCRTILWTQFICTAEVRSRRRSKPHAQTRGGRQPPIMNKLVLLGTMLIRLEIFPRRFHQAMTLINGFVAPLSGL